MSIWMKRVVLLVLSAFFLVGCGSDDDSNDSDDTGTTEQSASESSATNLALGSGAGDSFQEGVIAVDTTELGAGGSTQMSFNIVDREDGNSLYSGNPVEISISSPCLTGGDPLASLNGPLTFETSSGEISTRYTAEGCFGSELVTAQVAPEGETTGQASVVLEIAPPTAENITMGAPEPQSLAPSNAQSDARPSVSRVSFKVLGEGGAPVQGQQVNFSLNYDGGDALDPGAPSLETESDITGSSGEVVARVKAGTNNAVVRVVATLDSDSSISTSSLPIAVNTLMPVQERFSLSVEDYKPAAWATDGVSVEVTVRAADRLGNPVTGTIVNFVTSGGSIQGDCVLNDEGACSVTWVSQAPRPVDARTTIMARTVGEAGFTDSSGNGLYDDGEPYTRNRGEPFIDTTWTDDFDAVAGDVLFDKNGNGVWDGPNNQYVGSACPEGADFCESGTLPIWDDALGFWMASSTVATDLTLDGSYTGDGELYCARGWGVLESGATPDDGTNNTTPPPSGTSIEFEILSGDFEFVSPETSFSVTEDATRVNHVEQCVIVAEDPEGMDDGRLRVLVGGDNPAFDTVELIHSN